MYCTTTSLTVQTHSHRPTPRPSGVRSPLHTRAVPRRGTNHSCWTKSSSSAWSKERTSNSHPCNTTVWTSTVRSNGITGVSYWTGPWKCALSWGWRNRLGGWPATLLIGTWCAIPTFKRGNCNSLGSPVCTSRLSKRKFNHRVPLITVILPMVDSRILRSRWQRNRYSYMLITICR